MFDRRFQQTAERHPDQPAIVTSAGSVSYAELADRVERMAGGLVNELGEPVAGAPTGQPVVGLLFDPGAEMVTSVLAALRAGVIYVPLDPRHPDDRLRTLLADAGAAALLCDTAQEHRAAVLSADTEIRRLVAGRLDGPALPRPAENGDRAAYILYTSGSTGTPKGVLQSAANLARFAREWVRWTGLGLDDRVAWTAPLAHDASIPDLFGTLLAGATLLPWALSDARSLGALTSLFETRRITVWHTVPTVLRRWLTSLPANRSDTGENTPAGDRQPVTCAGLRWLILGGEAVVEGDLERARHHLPRASLGIVYGQSESTLGALWCEEPGSRRRPITLGHPLPGSQLLLVDDEGLEVGELGNGEVVVASPHVALGYWRDDELTRTRFVEDPEHGRLLFTGDLGRLTAEGEIVFVGRRDHQVKIRGTRVEPAEVESALVRHPAVETAVVVARRGADHELALHAFWVGAAPTPALGAFLRRRLPEAMIPSFFHRLDELPVLANGKIDRRALALRPLETTGDATPPEGPTERSLAVVWGELLGRQVIGRGADFFDLGGHSLAVLDLLTRIHRSLGVELTVREVVDHPTLAALARRIDQLRRPAFPAAEPVGSAPLGPVPSGERLFYPPSPVQRRLYALARREGVGTAYNMPLAIDVEGPLDRLRLRRALDELMARHESLRTAFVEREGEPVQVIYPATRCRLEERRVEEGEALEPIIESFVRPFDLARAPLVRFALLDRGGGRYTLLFDTHHIVCDGLSLRVLWRDVVTFYEGGRPAELGIHYRDWAIWQEARRLRGSGEGLAAWVAELAGGVPAVRLPTDFARPASLTFAGGRVARTVGRETAERFRRLVSAQGTTLFVAAVAVFTAVLHQRTLQGDIVLGASVSGRDHPALEPLVGMFVDQVVLWTRPRAELSFRGHLAAVDQVWTRARGRSEVSFDELVTSLGPPRDPSRNPLFDLSIAMQPGPAEIAAPSGWRPRLRPLRRRTSKFDLTLLVSEGDDGSLRFELEYRGDLFRRATLESLARQLVATVRRVGDDPTLALGDLVSHRRAVVSRGPVSQLPELPIHRLIVAEARRIPAAPAIEDDTGIWTYGELTTRAETLRQILAARHGVVRGDRVAVLFDGSAQMVASVLAVLAAGAAYVPLHPSLPEERLAFVLDETRTRWVISEQRSAPLLARLQTRCGWLEGSLYPGDIGRGAAPPSVPPAPAPPVSGQDVAYVLYTSGTTGRPKGVVVEHRSLVNYVLWARRHYSIAAGSRWALFTPLIFDLSVTSLFVPLLAGGCIRVYGGESPLLSVRRSLGDPTIDHLKATPSHLALLTEVRRPATAASKRSEPGGGKVLVLGGEDLNRASALAALEVLPEGTRLYNEYGPTEATVGAMVHHFRPHRDLRTSVPIGEAIDNVEILLLDGRLRPVGKDSAGELFIGGAGLAQGYLDRPRETAMAFLPAPQGFGARLYRTGDLARRRDDGSFEFLGRVDEQVKVRGVRVEPREIETHLMALPAVREAAVVARSEGAGPTERISLTAYVVARPSVVESELLEFLARRLPTEMVPQRVVELPALPLGPHGKLDRRALPACGPSAGATAVTEPGDPLSRSLAGLWADILGRTVDEVGLESSFFALGGHSLAAVTLASRARAELGLRFTLADVLRRPRLGDLVAGLVPAAGTGRPAGPRREEEREVYPASCLQTAVFRKHRANPRKYNRDPVVYRLRGPLDPRRLASALGVLAARHELLRTTFHEVDGEVVQRVRPTAVGGGGVELRVESVEPGQVDRRIARFRRPFALDEGPLWRVLLLRLDRREHLLLLDLHHILYDGESLTWLIAELGMAYRGETPPAPGLQFRDYALWERRTRGGEGDRRAREYWRRTLEGVRMTRWPGTADGTRSGMGLEERGLGTAGRLRWSADPGPLAASRSVVILAAFVRLLARRTGNDDVAIGLRVSTRRHAELDGVIGPFLDKVVLRLAVGEGEPWWATVARLRGVLADVVENVVSPWEELAPRLGLEARFPILINYQTSGVETASPLGREITVERHVLPVDLDAAVVGYPLILAVFDAPEGPRLRVVYDRGLYTGAEMRRLLTDLDAELVAATTVVGTAARVAPWSADPGGRAPGPVVGKETSCRA